MTICYLFLLVISVLLWVASGAKPPGCEEGKFLPYGLQSFRNKSVQRAMI